MRTPTPPFRLTAIAAATALLAGIVAPSSPAQAQSSLEQTQPDGTQPDGTQPDGTKGDQTQSDPPARVGRLARTTGTVSYHAAGETQWTPAAANFPLATGTAVWTEPNAQAELELSSSRIVMTGGTAIEIAALDANGLRATLSQGKMLLTPRDLAEGETWTVQTPRGSATLTRPGRVAIAAGDTATPTVIAVLEGSATLSGGGLDQTLTAGQSARVTGTDALQARIDPVSPEDLAEADSLTGRARGRPPLPPPARYQPIPPPPAIASLPGGDDLGAYGLWNRTPEYGEVWYPYVEPGWVPYRHGRWAYVAPWGWTWIDDAPWGFAPFHYGRWVQLQSRWAWVPGFEPQPRWGYPTYAPALVTFLGIGVGIGLATAPIGWVPLGPREPYRPWFHASNRYLGTVNRGHSQPIADGSFRNRSAATMVPASAMASSRSLRSVAQPIGPQSFAAARPLSGPHPVQPMSAPIGPTPHPVPSPRPSAQAPSPLRVAPLGAPIAPSSVAPILTRPGQQTPQFGVPPGVQRPAPQVVAPAGVQHPTLPFAAPPGVQHPPPQIAAPLAAPRPAPQFGAPPALQHPAPQIAAPPAAPRPAPQFAAPPAVQRPTPQFSAPPAAPRPTPQFQAPPPVQRPAPQFQAPPAAPRPTPQFTAPTPQFQAPAPQFRAPAPAAPPPPAHRDKRPGER